MILTLILPSEAEADITAKTETGQVVRLKSLTIQPHFWKPNSTPAVLFFENKTGEADDEAEGKLIQRGVIQVSGQHGRLTVVDRTNATLSQAEHKLLTAGSEEADEEDEAEEPDEEGDDNQRKRGTKNGR